MRKTPFSTPKKSKAPKIEVPPAPRRLDFERLLCDAIAKEKLVSLKYPGDIRAREFEPGAVYYSSANPQKINVGGCQIVNPNNPLENMQPHVFEVGKIVSLALTEKSFVVRERIDVRDPRYVNGLICYFKKPSRILQIKARLGYRFVRVQGVEHVSCSLEMVGITI